VSKRNLFLLVAITTMAFATACLTVDQEDATATIEAGGTTNRDFLVAEATSNADDDFFYDDLLIYDATSTAEAGGFDDRLTTATAETIEIQTVISAEYTATAIVDDATSTAEAIEDATALALDPSLGDRQVLKRGASEVVEIPTPTVAPVPTAVPTPPTATPQPVVLNQWLTAFQALDLLAKQQDGIVWQVVAHVASRPGQFGSGDLTASIPSPGAGYSAMWEMSLYEDGDNYFCSVWLQGTACSLSNFADDSDKTNESIAGASVDSIDVIAFWAGQPEWIELTSNDDISILLVLESSAGANSPLRWQASITVHNATDGLRGGNFNWIPETGESNFTTFP
jgi:hypothetical protein